nr:hypothetical protein [Candidatus Sigynarchaeum springense]
MGKKLTRAGMELRRTIRADIDANPAADHLLYRSKYKVGEGIVESALTRTVAEWDALIAATPEDKPRSPLTRAVEALDEAAIAGPAVDPARAATGGPAMPGIEQGLVKFARKPAKMGTDYVFWIPRVYVRNGLVDPACEYDVFLKKRE